MVADAPASQISSVEQRTLVDGLHKELADVAPFTTELGPPIGNVAGAVMDVWPEDQAVPLQERVRAAIRATRGDAALSATEDLGPPGVSELAGAAASAAYFVQSPLPACCHCAATARWMPSMRVRIAAGT
jgi:hypothetical protein